MTKVQVLWLEELENEASFFAIRQGGYKSLGILFSNPRGITAATPQTEPF